MTKNDELSFVRSGCESFDGFSNEMTFECLWNMGHLDREDRILASLAALASRGYVRDFVRHAEAAVYGGMDAVKPREVAIHVSMYAGIPRASEIVRALNDIGLSPVEDDSQRYEQSPQGDRANIGAEIKETLHRERAGLDYASSASSASELYNVATDFLYGDLWVRQGLSIRQRMVCSIASFTALSLTSQQRKFFRSAVNLGISKQQVVEVIGQTAPYSGFAPALAAIAVADEVITD